MVRLLLEEAEKAVASTGEVIYVINGEPAFADTREGLIPLLPFLLRHGHDWLPSVEVDRGASIAVSKGADLMTPGITAVRGEFAEGDLVVVVDETSKAPVVVGRALIDSSTLREKVAEKGRGKAVKNLHRPGDRLWTLALLLARKQSTG
jgi:PUA domain protein